MEPALNQIRDQQRQTWDKFSTGWKKWDDKIMQWIAPVGNELIRNAALTSTSQLLDIAAGTGEPGLTAASHVPKGNVTVTDLSDQMLAFAAENAHSRGIKNFATRQCDVSAMPFADKQFDAITCRFGFMFFPDIAISLNEMIRVAKPGARISSAIWCAPEKNPWATTIMSTIAAHVEMPAISPGAPGLFRCAPAKFMSDAYRVAGLKNIVEKEISGELAFNSPEEYWNMMTDIAAPVVAGLAKADAVTHDKIKKTVQELAAKTATDGGARFRWSALAVCGEK